MREEVKDFAQAMEDKLKIKDKEYNGWDNCSLDFLTLRLRQETTELLQALRLYHMFPSEDTRKRVEDECVDVSNFSMMIRDLVNKGAK